jgi:hypothetical protein
MHIDKPFRNPRICSIDGLSKLNMFQFVLIGDLFNENKLIVG